MMGRLAEELWLVLHGVPMAGRLLAWFIWITLASPATTVVGLALIGLGFFSPSGDADSGTLKLFGVEVSGNVRPMMIAGGLMIYLLGGGLLAPPQPQKPVSFQVSGLPTTSRN